MSDSDHAHTQPAAGSSQISPHSPQLPPPRHLSPSAHHGPPGHVRNQWQTRPDQSSIPRIVTYPPLERSRRPRQPSQPLGNQHPPRPQGSVYENTPRYDATAGIGSASNQSLNTPQGHSGAAARRQPPPRPRRPDHQDPAGSSAQQGTRHITPVSRPRSSMIPLPAIEALPQILHEPSPEFLYRQELYALARARWSLAPPPPSARRGPPTYYPTIAQVTSIPEESDTAENWVDTDDSSDADDLSHDGSTETLTATLPGYTAKHARSTVDLASHPSAGPSDPTGAKIDGFEQQQPLRQQQQEQQSGARGAESSDRDRARELAQSTDDDQEPSITVLSGDRVKRLSIETARQVDIDQPRQQQQQEHQNEGRGTGSLDGSDARELAQSTDNDQGTSITVLSGDRVKRLSIETARQVDIDQPRRVQAEDGNAVPLPGASQQSPTSTSVDSSDDSPLAVTAPTSLKSKHSGDRLSTRIPGSETLAETNSLLNPSSSAIDVAPTSRLSIASGTGSRSTSQHNTSRSPSPLGTTAPRKDVASESGQTNSPPPVPAQDQLPLPTPGFSGRQGDTRNQPSHLDVSSIRAAELRGSLTSLPDLIKRATKLASNLDRGRTASRLGINRVGAEEEKRGSDRYSTGLSDIIASFPSPAVATPPLSRAGKVRQSMTNRFTRNRQSELGSVSPSETGSAGRPPRKYCGLTLRNFILLCIVLFLLLVAAVVVPVGLIVLPRHRHHNTDAGNSQLAQCQTTMSCDNGGVTTYTNGVCGCICINGFTGSRCDSASQQDCTTTSVGSMTNASVGNDIPRIVSNAQSEFGIPLDAQALLGLFSAADLSCNAENALVTFTNVVQRDLLTLRIPDMRDDQTTFSAGSAATSNGILFATTSTPSATTASSTATTAASSSSSSANTTTATTTDFARTAVLYIFQSSGHLDTAVTAQGNLQDYFDNRTSATSSALLSSNLTLGDGFTCDLNTLQLRLGNGTVVNGRL